MFLHVAYASSLIKGLLARGSHRIGNVFHGRQGLVEPLASIFVALAAARGVELGGSGGHLLGQCRGAASLCHDTSHVVREILVILFGTLLYTVIFIYHGVRPLEVEMITMLLLRRGRRPSSLLAASVGRAKQQQRVALLGLVKLSVLLGGSCCARQDRFFLVKELMRESVR